MSSQNSPYNLMEGQRIFLSATCLPQKDLQDTVNGFCVTQESGNVGFLITPSLSSWPPCASSRCLLCCTYAGMHFCRHSLWLSHSQNTSASSPRGGKLGELCEQVFPLLLSHLFPTIHWLKGPFISFHFNFPIGNLVQVYIFLYIDIYTLFCLMLKTISIDLSLFLCLTHPRESLIQARCWQ